MTPQQRIDFAREFILGQTSLEACVAHEQIQHQLRAAGFELLSHPQPPGHGRVFTIGARGERECNEIKSINDLVQYLR